MNKFLKMLIGMFLLLSITSLLFAGCSTPDTDDTTAIETVPEGKYKVPVLIYVQNVDNGSYELEKEAAGYPELGKTMTYTPEDRAYYDVDTEKSTLTAKGEGDVIKVYYTCETCEVRFEVGDATITEGSASGTIRKGQKPTPPTLSLKGYTCAGYDKPIERVFEDTVFTARFEKTKYRLYLHATADTILPEGFVKSKGNESCFEATYTFEDSITVPKPESRGYTFIEWNTSPDGKGEKIDKIPIGTYHDTSLYAIYTVKLSSIVFTSVDGVTYPAYYLREGTPIQAPVIAPEHQKAGYGLSWYSDSACTKLYDFRTMPSGSLTLYGRWEKDTGSGFLSFDHTEITNNSIDSLDELIVLLDYIRFHNITDATNVKVTYADKTTLENDIKKVQRELIEFRSGGSIAYGIAESDASCTLTLYVGTSYRDTEATKTAERNGRETYRYLAPSVTPRGDDYSDFYIDKLTNTYPVSTSNQLLYVVEHGYRPLPEKNSPAERAYLEAKAILNKILPENATAFEKAELIFNYLITSIEYDDNAVNITAQNPSIWPEYDAFYLEGAIFQKKAVCDGIASAYSLFCNMEGIPCVKVIGDNHAWTRVKLNNRWYVADPTFGASQVIGKNYALTDHSHFLISDAEKAAGGYTGYNYKSITADKSYGYFESKQVTYKGADFDFKIDSATELASFLAYINSLIDPSQNTSVNIIVNTNDIGSLYSSAMNLLRKQGVTLRTEPKVYQSGTVYQLVFLKKTSKNPYSAWNRDFFRCYVRCKVLCSDDSEFHCRA